MSALRPWHLLLAALALVVPLQAAALEGEGAPLTVSASHDFCGVADTGIVCKVDASWSGVDGAERFTAAVTLADGSVQEMGTTGTGSGGGATALYVPYAGDGVYTVTISAWGADPDGNEGKVGQDEADAKVDKPAKAEKSSAGKTEAKSKPAPEPDPAEEGGEGAAEQEAAEEPSKLGVQAQKPGESAGDEAERAGEQQSKSTTASAAAAPPGAADAPAQPLTP